MNENPFQAGDIVKCTSDPCQGDPMFGLQGEYYVVTNIKLSGVYGHNITYPNEKLEGGSTYRFKLISRDYSYKPTNVPVDASKWTHDNSVWALGNLDRFDIKDANVSAIRGWCLVTQLCAFASNGIVWRTNPEHDVVTITVSRQVATRAAQGYNNISELRTAARKALS